MYPKTPGDVTFKASGSDKAEEGRLSNCSEWTGIEIDTGGIYQAKLDEQVADLRFEKTVGMGKAGVDNW